MAEELLEEVDVEDQPSGKGKIIILAVVGLVLIAASVVGTLYFLGAFSDDVATGEQSAEEKEEEPLAPAIYFPLRPPLIVAFSSRGRQRFLQAHITIMSRDQEAIEAVQLHMPMIRNNLTMLYGSQEYDALRGREGREFVRQKTIEEIQTILTQEIGRPGIENIYFTNYVMQ